MMGSQDQEEKAEDEASLEPETICEKFSGQRNFTSPR